MSSWRDPNAPWTGRQIATLVGLAFVAGIEIGVCLMLRFG